MITRSSIAFELMVMMENPESHGASNETQLGLRLDLLVSLDVVKGRRVKVDLHQLKGRLYLIA